MKAETAVLLSGGLDSAVLVAHEAQDRIVQPIFIATGLAWETDERAAIHQLLDALTFGNRLRSLVELEVSVRDIYAPSHWALVGTPPSYDTPDEDVYLHGRNVILLSKAALWCATRHISRLTLGPLAANPFPDATTEFFDAMSRALSLGLDHPIQIVTPFSQMHKPDVIRLGVELHVPLELTLSCMSPINGQHCGSCSKCRERHDAFVEAGVSDPTTYANHAPR